jgi:hypothetical protein
MNLQNLRAKSAFFLVLVAIGTKASPQLETIRKPVNAFLFGATLQGAECSPQDLLAALTPRDAEYTDALELTQTLHKHGLAVKCVLHSKRVTLFEGQRGAAFYRTNRGNFDALFLPTAETFNVQPNETRKNGWYIYSFGGSPRPTGGPWNCARPTYFTQHANQLFVTQHAQLISGLDRALASTQTK